MNIEAVNDNEVITKSYVDQFDSVNKGNRTDVGFSFCNEEVDLVKNNQDNDFNDNKLTNSDSITVIRNPSLDNEEANKKHVDDSIGEGNVLRFIQTLEN